MDINLTNENNLFVDEILENKRVAFENVMVEEIKEELCEYPHVYELGDKKDDWEEAPAKRMKERDSCEGGLSGQGRGVGGCDEMSQDYSLKEEELREKSIKEEIGEEFLDDQSSLPDENEKRVHCQAKKTTTTDTRVQNCHQEKNTEKHRWLAPPAADDSDIEVDLEMDDEDIDSEYLLHAPDEDLDDSVHQSESKSKKDPVKVMPRYDSDDDDDDDEEEEDEVEIRKPPAKQRRYWRKEDITNTPLPKYEHKQPQVILDPYHYFERMFTIELIDHIVYQTNLYVRQSNVNTTFHTERQEVMVFIGILLYMGVNCLPAVEDYWAVETRVPQVADSMSSKRFRWLRSNIHFNDNQQAAGSVDRFYKIRPIITSITKAFMKIPATYEQSVDEVMVGYKGARAGNLKQYIQNKPDKYGYKLFCRASSDSIIHDIIMYQGESTFPAHVTEFTPEEMKMNKTEQIVISLVKTLKHHDKSTIYTDNYFTSIGLAEHLRDKYNCRYVGTARENRIGDPSLTSAKEMKKKKVPKGTLEYCSTQSILAVRWMDNKPVTILSTDAGIQPMSTVMRWDKNTKEKKEVPCPNVIKRYINRIGGVDKSDMLVHLYKTPLKSKSWYMRLFAYSIDLCVSNAWLLYKRDCVSIDITPMSLKDFRLSISKFARLQGLEVARMIQQAKDNSPSQVTLLRRGQKSPEVSTVVRHSAASSLSHLPTFAMRRQTCKHCSKKGNIHRSKWMCVTCNVALCLSDKKNCFLPFHDPSKV